MLNCTKKTSKMLVNSLGRICVYYDCFVSLRCSSDHELCHKNEIVSGLLFMYLRLCDITYFIHIHLIYVHVVKRRYGHVKCLCIHTAVRLNLQVYMFVNVFFLFTLIHFEYTVLVNKINQFILPFTTLFNLKSLPVFLKPNFFSSQKFMENCWCVNNVCKARQYNVCTTLYT